MTKSASDEDREEASKQRAMHRLNYRMVDDIASGQEESGTTGTGLRKSLNEVIKNVANGRLKNVG